MRCDCTHPDHDFACPNREPVNMECPVGHGACPDLPVAGPGGVVRHLLAVHPEAPITRAIFAALVRVQLVDADTAAEVAR